MYDSKPKQLVHQLLEAIFSGEELNNFCREYFPEVSDRFTPHMDNASKIRLLIETCDQDNQLGKLVLNIKSVKPEAYQAFVDRIGISDQPAESAAQAKPQTAPATITIFPKGDGSNLPTKQIQGEIIPDAEALLSQSLAGRYQIEEVLDKSGLAAVFKAHDTKLEIDVAIKLIDLERVKQATLKERVRQEVRTAMQLDHPGIVKVYDFGQTDSLLYIIMEFIPGYNLRQARQYFKTIDSKIALPQVIQLFEQICLTVDYMHHRRVLHPGTKPENVMLKQGPPNQETAWRPIMINLGLLRPNKEMVKARDEISSRRLIYTVSPELLLGHATDIRTDVYALGILLYDLAVGQAPFRPKDIMEAVHFHVETPPPLPRSINPDISEKLEGIILEALAKNPADRFLSAKGMAQALAECLHEISLPASTVQVDKPTTSGIMISTDVQQLTVEPGESIATIVTLRKQGGQDERCQITVQGVPEAWVSISPSVTTLSPGEEQEVELSIHPPRSPESRAGRHSLAIQVVNQASRKQVDEIKQVLTIVPYSQFRASLWPKEISSGQMTQMTIENQGNAPETFTVRPKPDENLTCKPEQVQVKLAPGESGTADFNISPKGQFLVAEAATHTFSFQVSSSQGRTDIQSGQVTSQGMLAPKWVFGVLLAVALVLCAVVSVILSVGGSLFGEGTAAGEAADAQPPAFDVEATETAQWELGDVDNDGLSNLEEDKNNSDPQSEDTDGDGLTDWQEVIVYGTNPRLEDSDTDDVRDKQEILNGTDPLVPNQKEDASGEFTPSVQNTELTPVPITVQFSRLQTFLGGASLPGGQELRFRVDEGDGTAKIQVVLSAPTAQRIEISYVLEDFNATQGEDFDFTPGTLVFEPNGPLRQSFPVEIIDDEEPSEGDEIIILNLKTPSFGGIQRGNFTSLQLIIVDND